MTQIGSASISLEAKDTLTPALIRLENVILSLTKTLQGQGSAFDGMEKGAKKAQASVDTLSKSFATLKSGLIALGGFVVFKSLATEAGNFERSMIDVQNATGASDGVVGKLDGSLKNLSNRLGVSRQRLGEMSVSAVKLGIDISNGVDGLENFVKSVVKIQTLQPDFAGGNADEAANIIAKLNNVLGNNVEQTENLVSSLSSVADAGTSNANQLSNLLLRFGSFGKAVGASQEQLTGLAGTLIDVGLSEEVAGTSIGDFFTRINTDTAKFVTEIGKINPAIKETFANQIATNGVDALKTFSTELSKLPVQQATTLMKDLGLTGAGTVRTILGLAQGVKAGADGLSILDKNIQAATFGFQNLDSFNQKYLNTLTSSNERFAFVGNQVKNLALDFVSKLLPGILSVTSSLSELIASEGFQTGFDKFLTFVTVVADAISSLLVPAINILSEAFGPVFDWILSFAPATQELMGVSDELASSFNGVQQQLEALEGLYESGKITSEDYATQKAILMNQSEDLQKQIDNEVGLYKELNAEYIESQKQISENNIRIAELTEKIQTVNGQFDDSVEGQKAAAFYSMKYQEELDGLISSNNDLSQVQERQIVTQQEVNKAVSSISTAKSVDEFYKLQLSALGVIKGFVLTLKAQKAFSKGIGDTEGVNRAIEGLKGLAEVAKEVGSLKPPKNLPQTSPTPTGETTTGTTSGSKGRSGKSTAQKEAEKAQKEAEKQAKKELQDAEKLAKEKIKLKEKEAELLEDLANAERENAKAIYEGTLDDIKKVEDKIKDLDKQIKGIQDEISSLEASQTTGIAQRVVEINELLKDQTLKAEERLKLEEELALATANTTAKEVDKQTKIAGESETERILRETAEKKTQLETQLAEAQLAKDKEIQQLEIFNANKEKLENDYTLKYKDAIQERETAEVKSIERIKKALLDLRSIQPGGSSSDGGSLDLPGFADGGHTGGGKRDIAGVVHGKEYVIPEKVLSKLGGSGIIPILEKMRKGFYDGGPTTQLPTNMGSRTNTFQVQQNINNPFDAQIAIQALGRMYKRFS